MKKLKKLQYLILLIFSFLLLENIKAQIHIDLPENPECTQIPSPVRGFNQGDFSVGSWYQLDSDTFRTEFPSLLPGIIRWPGGTNANNYIWKDYINDSSRFHLVNAVELIRDLNMALQYLANFGNGSAHDAADFIRLCNSNDSYWQNKRTSLFGNNATVNLKICEIGNENNYTHAWVSAWFGRARNEKIYFRDSTYIDFPDYIPDSLYFYGGDMWRGGWIEENTIIVHGHYTDAILGEKYIVQPDDADTIIIPVTYPKIGNDSIYVWTIDTILTMDTIDAMNIQEMYNLITEPQYLLDTNYFSILGDTAVMVYPDTSMNPGELIYIEYQSVEHDGAFAFRDSILAVDTTVKIGYSVWPNDSLFSQTFFRDDFVQSPPDFIIRHTYPNTKDIQQLVDNNYFSEIPYLPQQLVQYIISGQQYIDSVTNDLGLSQRLGIAITEWSFANAECDTCKMYLFDGIIGAINTAMFAASYMEAMHDSTINLFALNFHILIRKWGSNLCIYHVTPDSLKFTVTSRAHAMRIINNTIGTKFFMIDSADITGNPMIDILTKNTAEGIPPFTIDTITIPAVKIWGGIDSLHQDYSLLLINQDDSLGHEISFAIPSGWSVDTVFRETMTGEPNDSIYDIYSDTLLVINDSISIMLTKFSLTALRFHTDTTFTYINDKPVSYFNYSIYPNPSKGIIYIETHNAENLKLSLEISNITGQIIYSKQFENTSRINEQINLSKQPKGMYFIKLRGKNITTVEKILIQ